MKRLAIAMGLLILVTDGATLAQSTGANSDASMQMQKRHWQRNWESKLLTLQADPSGSREATSKTSTFVRSARTPCGQHSSQMATSRRMNLATAQQVGRLARVPR